MAFPWSLHYPDWYRGKESILLRTKPQTPGTLLLSWTAGGQYRVKHKLVLQTVSSPSLPPC